MYVGIYISKSQANTKKTMTYNFSIWSNGVKAQIIVHWAFTEFDMVDTYEPL